ncbi:MAG: SCP2 sterol-binding domain-containing protein [Microthrixaceae bacterium]
MAQYLSEEWLEQTAAALAADTAFTEAIADVDLSILYEVTASPTGKTVYCIRMDHGVTSLVPGPAKDAHVSFGMDYDTAAAIAQGQVSAQAAFMQGRLKLGGDPTILIRQHAAIDGFSDALATLRESTSY